jgi:hypothetical protein
MHGRPNSLSVRSATSPSVVRSWSLRHSAPILLIVTALLAIGLVQHNGSFRVAEITKDSILARIVGSQCLDYVQKDCTNIPPACGDIECIFFPEVGGMRCPENAEGAHEVQETYDDCTGGHAAGYYNSAENDQLEWCYKTALCRFDGCIQATNLVFYCANGPNTPQPKYITGVRECTGNRNCPNGT